MMQQSTLLAVQEAREVAKTEKIARLTAEQEALLASGTAPWILLLMEGTNSATL